VLDGWGVAVGCDGAGALVYGCGCGCIVLVWYRALWQVSKCVSSFDAHLRWVQLLLLRRRRSSAAACEKYSIVRRCLRD
jgi:hypothetical protein